MLASSYHDRSAATPATRGPLSASLVTLCIALPWVQPFAPGPSVNVVPLLVSWACAVLALALTSPPRAMVGWLIAAVGAGMAARLFQWDPQVVAVGGSLFAAACCWGTVAHGEHRDRVATAIAQGWLWAALVSSVIALLQYFELSDRLQPLAAAASGGEAYANLRQRNQFATLTTLGLVSLLWLNESWPRARTVAAIVLLAAANAAASSRVGLLQWLVLIMAALAWRGPQRRPWATWALFAVGCYVVAALALPYLAEMLTGHAGNSLISRMSKAEGCNGRAVLWPNVLELISVKPLTGWGWGELDYAHYMNLYRQERFCDILDNAHNLPLHIAVELGLPATIGVCGLVAWAIVAARPWREGRPQAWVGWNVIAAIALHSLVEYPLWYGPFQLAAGFAVGMLWASPRHARQPRASAGWLLALLACAGAALTYAAWDYGRISQIYVAPESRWQAYREDTLEKIRGSWLFRNQVLFAEFTITPLTPANASWSYETALQLLHYSPEPRVIEKLIESALLVGQDQVALAHLARFRAAFPREHAQWARERGLAAASAPVPVKD